MEYSKLYERHNYTNKSIDYLIGDEIIEYDIKSAGMNLCKEFGLISEDKVAMLESLGKYNRNVQLGLYQRADKTLVKRLNEKFVEARRLFFEANDIKDVDVLSIKKDALFITKRCKNLTFGNIIFVPKNVYTSYCLLNGMEIYTNRQYCHLKGIEDKSLEAHKEYMLDFFKNFFTLLETSTEAKTISYLKEFMFLYKTRELHVGYYRQLNRYSGYLFDDLQIHDSFNTVVEQVEPSDVDRLNISYNYTKYLIPLISILI